jgi:acyl-coenzyme A synthetase/AMP-(fatty) acid ligase
MKVDCKTLIAFVTPSHVNPEQAQESVRAHLPYYCVPKVVFALDSLPKTSRGKIDRRALMAHFQESKTEVTEETQ